MRVCIVGGGLAGMAAAWQLAEHGCVVHLWEATRALGGRAGSWREPDSDVWLDHCQHVSMGCCTNLADLVKRAELDDYFIKYETLHFLDRQGIRSDFAATPYVPAPFHLSRALLGMRFLTWRERGELAIALLAMARTPGSRIPTMTVADWLGRRRMSDRLIRRFWSPVLVSALSETLDRIAYSVARKVLVDGFMASREAFFLQVPRIPLGELYDQHLRAALERQGVTITTQARVTGVAPAGDGVSLELASGDVVACDQVILAVPWRHAASLIAPAWLEQLETAAPPWDSLESGSIAAVHLWYDRPILELPHAVLLERQAQWIFARGESIIPRTAGRSGYYYQVVISASHAEAKRTSAGTIADIAQELRELFPAAAQAKLVGAQVVTQTHAVFAPTVASTTCRPLQQTCVPQLVLAGDWTATGWPATMEGAVISGYRAAECVLHRLGRPQSMVIPPLRKNQFASWLIGEG